jgi:hypothetical protein
LGVVREVRDTLFSCLVGSSRLTIAQVTIRKPVLAQEASTVDGLPLRSTLLQPPPLIYFMPSVYSNGAVIVQPMLPPMKATSIQADQDEAAEVLRGSAPKRRKVPRVFTASKKHRQTPEVPKVDEIFYYMDGSMMINGVSHFPHQFFIFVDVNGMQHMIIIRSSCRAPGEYHESAPRWCHRVVFPNSPGFFSRIHDDIDSEIREGTGRFHRVASLAGFRPKDPWWLQGSGIVPDILDRPQPGESLSFPRIQKFAREGDLVTLIGSYAMFRVMAVTVYNGVKSFFVVSIAPGNPVFPRAVMRVVLNEDIGGPLIQWRTKPEFWGDYMYDAGTENTLYYRRLESGPIRGSIVSVPGSVPRETARVVNYWIDPSGVQFFRVSSLVFLLGLFSFLSFSLVVFRCSSRSSIRKTPSGRLWISRRSTFGARISALKSRGSSGPRSPWTPLSVLGGPSSPRSSSRPP